MAEALVDGRGSGNYAGVDSTNRLMVVGSITNMPSISVGSLSVSAGSESYIKGGSVAVYTSGLTIIPGSIVSMPAVSVTAGSEQWIQNVVEVSGGIFTGGDLTGSVVISDSVRIGVSGNVNITTGSIQVNSGSIAISNFNAIGSTVLVDNLYAGSEVWAGDTFPISGVVTADTNLYAGSSVWQGEVFGVSGAIDINDPTTIGSYPIQNVTTIGSTEVFSSTGSVEVYGALSATAGSESWIRGGSVEVTTGSIYVTNFSAGTGYAGSDSYIVAGSVSVIDIGSVEVFSSTGSVEVYGSLSATAGSESWIKGGSIHLYSGTSYIDIPNRVAGSIVNWPDIIGSFYWAGGVGSMVISGAVTANQGTVYGVSGIVEIGTTVDVSGAIFTGGDLTGSFAIQNFDAIGSTVVVDNFGVLGSSRIVTAGSVIVTNEMIIENIGSPCYKQATAIASGTYTQAWSIGGAGSRVEMHGYHISTNLPGIVRIVGSATTPTLISESFLNYASGAVIEKTFSSPIVPRGANIPLGFQTTSAGSTAVTIYGREVV